MAPRDTTAEAQAVQVEAWRRLGADGRLVLALELSEAAMAITRDGIRDRRPDLDDTESTDELLRRLGLHEART